jgi:hypothetical protein
MACVGLLLDFGVGRPYADNHLILALVVGVVAGLLLIVRCFRVRICVTTVSNTPDSRFQFSIRQLLILTTAIACITSLGKWLGPHMTPRADFSLVALIGFVLAAVGLISVWPVLGTRQPILPSTMAVVIAAGIGFCLAMMFPPVAAVELLWITITSIEALSLIVSLLVVRSSGHRLVRLPTGNSRIEHGTPGPETVP